MGKHKQKAKKRRADVRSVPDVLAGGARDVWLAGLGALDRARKEGGDYFDELVARGEAARREAGEAVDAALELLDRAREEAQRAAAQAGRKARSAARAPAEAVEDRVEAAVRRALQRAGIPRRDEVAALSAQVQALASRLERLSGEAATPVVVRVAPREGGWAVEREGAGRAASVHRTKKEALGAGRSLARAHAPSRLVVLRADGTEAETTAYGV